MDFIEPNLWSLLVTLPLYLFHLVFLINIAFKSKRVKITDLYLFGVLFGLYESWITKVLWVGYMSSDKPIIGTLFGVSIAEFPILVLFWHPIMSFLLPILTYEIVTNQVITTHNSLIKKTKLKTMIILVCLLCFSSFIANGNSYHLLSTNLALVVTLFIVILLSIIVKRKNFFSLIISNKRLIIISGYLVILYLLTFFYLLPESIPNQVAPYLTIIIFYLFIIFLITKIRHETIEIQNPLESTYRPSDLIKFSLLIIIFVNIACVVPFISNIVLILSYIVLNILGIIIFIKVLLFYYFNRCSNKTICLTKKSS